MGQPAKQEFHDLLDDLCRQEVFGSIVFRFQKGDVVSVSDSLEWKPNEICEAYGKKTEGLKKKILIVRKRPDDDESGKPVV